MILTRQQSPLRKLLNLVIYLFWLRLRGKTVFTQDLERRLESRKGLQPDIHFARTYQGTLEIQFHLDVYRIDQIEEVRDLALPELFEGNSSL